jgi:D-lactate dehydrogenase
MLDVFFYEAFEEEDADIRRFLPANIAADYAALTIQESGHAAPPARIISTRTQSIVPVEWAPVIDAILTRSTGYDHLVAYRAIVSAPPAMGYLPLYCQRAVAEQALLMWLALLRRLPQQVAQFQAFHRDGISGGECQGRTLVVVGVGNIGHEVCRIGHALGMKVLGVDLLRKHSDIEYLSIDDALPQADVLVCAMDLNPTSVGYFDMAKWRRVKPGCVFVNISRGELSPSTHLVQALDAGHLAGVGLDVFDHEAALAVALRTRSPVDDAEVAATLELARRPDAICTPHNAFNSIEAVQRKSEQSIEQLVAFLSTGRFIWPVPTI